MAPWLAAQAAGQAASTVGGIVASPLLDEMDWEAGSIEATMVLPPAFPAQEYETCDMEVEYVGAPQQVRGRGRGSEKGSTAGRTALQG